MRVSLSLGALLLFALAILLGIGFQPKEAPARIELPEAEVGQDVQRTLTDVASTAVSRASLLGRRSRVGA